MTRPTDEIAEAAQAVRDGFSDVINTRSQQVHENPTDERDDAPKNAFSDADMNLYAAVKDFIAVYGKVSVATMFNQMSHEVMCYQRFTYEAAQEFVKTFENLKDIFDRLQRTYSPVATD